MNLILNKNIIAWFILLLPFVSTAQKQVVSGIVLDGEDLHPIPFANIAVEGTYTGTISKTNGKFELTIQTFPQTITFSSVGYYPYSYYAESTVDSMIVILQPRDFQLDEIVIKAGENPANIIMRKVIANREKNNPLRYNSYESNAYTKILVNALTSANSDFFAKNEMPLFFSEKISRNYYQKEPPINKGVILEENQNGLGFLNQMSVVGYENNMSLEYNFYDNVIEMFDKPFISPLNNSALFYYKFYLKDSIISDFGEEYLLEFQPKNRNDLAFKGTMRVVKDSWQLSEISASIPTTANLNFVNKLHLHHTFQLVDDSLSFFKLNETNAELKITKDNAIADIAFAARLNKQTYYSNIHLNEPISDSVNVKENFQKQHLTLLNQRPVELSITELDAIEEIDSLNNLWQVRSADALSQMFITGYFPGKYIDIGPYLELLKYNQIEGYRYTFAARTSNDFTKNLMLYGHVGYGMRDQVWKYGSGFKYKLLSDHRSIVGFEYRKDMTKIGDNGSIFLIKENMMVAAEDNLVASIFTNSALDKLGLEERYRFKMEHEWRVGLSSTLEANYRKLNSGKFIPFQTGGQAVDYLNIREVKFGMRWSWQERFSDNYCRRYYMSTKYPIINLRVTGGQFEMNNVWDNFYKLRAVVNHDVNFGQTKFEYIWEAGAIFGKVPFPLLDIQRTDQSLGYALYSFNMMDEMEFAADRFTSLMAQYHLNGMLLNRIPLLNRMQFREVFSAKMLVSNLSEAHREVMDYPVLLKDAKMPYVELSAGLENVFKYFRFDLIWRMNYNETYDKIPLGIRARFDVVF